MRHKSDRFEGEDWEDQQIGFLPGDILSKFRPFDQQAELRSKYNAVVARFGTGAGVDIVAPDKASFRHVAHTRGIES